MGKSSKKSTPKVDAAPAVTPDPKSSSKGQREARELTEAIEKLVNAKKRKIDDGAKQAVKKGKVEVKTQKKKKDESSSSDNSSSEEEQKAKVVTKKVQKETKSPVEESSSEESSSDEEAPPKAAKNGSVGVPATQRKGDSSSDSSDDESDEEEVKVVVKKGVKATKPPVEESSGEDESSSDEEPHAKAALPPKKQQLDAKNGLVSAPRKGKAESSSSESSDYESDEDEKKPPAVSQVKKLPQTGTKKASAASSESDSDSSSDEELPAKASAPKIVPQGVTNKKAKSGSSSDESESSEESDSDEEKASAKAPATKKVALTATNNKAQSSDDSDDSDSDESSDEDEGTTTKATKAVSKVQTSKKSNGNGSSESESDDSDSYTDSDSDAPATKAVVGSKRPSSVAQTKESKKVKVATQKESSSSEESSSDSSDDEEQSEDEKPTKTPKNNSTDVEMVDAATPHATTKKTDLQSAKKAPKTPVTSEVQSTGSKTLFVGNLPFEVERPDVESFFEGAGEIVDIRFAMDKEQRFKGFGHVEFATTEAAQKALKLNGQSLNGRQLRLDLARERGERASYTPYSGSRENSSFQKGGRGQAQKIFVRGFDTSLGENEIRSVLGEHFETCGEITRISIPTNYETGAIKGMAYLEFKDADGFNKALELSGSQLGDQYLTVEEAKPPRSDNRDAWGSGRGAGRSGGGRSGGRDGGGRFGSRGGGRGRGRGTPYKPSVTAVASGKKTTFKDDE
ncbi:nucleolin 2 isoform X6 [Hevea brasiliensis]|uniref:nucleolin 2 isoform X6 n=1 Tax=Hevea brasiliensis TaxID=3981 RepID=UPI0025D22785|nr:nucleolin 2 isoform X6 [Hevea brasiliensis]